MERGKLKKIFKRLLRSPAQQSKNGFVLDKFGGLFHKEVFRRDLKHG